jgi:hypothetical protein
MNTNFIRKIVFATILIVATLNAFADEAFDSVKKKEYNQTFAVGTSDRLSIDNRYGSISISHWSKSEVSIRVEVIAKASNEKNADIILDRISVDLSKSGNTVSGITSIKSQSINFKSGMEINYFINMPEQLDITLAMKYGNITLPEQNGGLASIDLKYGKIRAGNFSRNLSLDASYSDVLIGSTDNASLNLRYCGSTSIGNARTISIDARYSNIKAQSADRLSMESHYGNLDAQDIRQASLEFHYGNIELRRLREELSVDALSYGNLTIKELDASFKRISVSPKYGNVKIGIASTASFNVNTSGMKYGNATFSGLKATGTFDANDRNKRTENTSYTINGGGSATINFSSNGYSNLDIKAL